MTECMPISTPPLTYSLDRPGTSGVITGPEVAIMDAVDNMVSAFTPGRICLRGSPLFDGYLRPDGSLDKSAFNLQGWFDTGDVGYLDEDGYLYLTGRNKEVINRGGELISPFEVENAIIMAADRQDSPTFGRITQALAFSVRHEALQEVVGIVLVTPPGKPRVDLRCLHESLKSSLQSVKRPVLIVYMDDVPKRNNKVLRVKLGERLNIPCIDDDTLFSKRHYLAQCPPSETALSVPIPSSLCPATPDQAYQEIEQVLPPTLEIYIKAQPQTEAFTAYLAPKSSEDDAPGDGEIASLRDSLFTKVHGYLVPQSITALPKPLPRDSQGRVDGALLAQIIKEDEYSSTRETLPVLLDGSATARALTRMFAEILQLRARDVAPQRHFFDLGGDSLRAGRLASTIRADLGVRVPIDLVFRDGSVEALAAYVDEELAARNSNADSGDAEPSATAEEQGKTCSSTNPFLLLLQLTPMLVVYPLRRALPWTFFMYALVYSQNFTTNSSIPGRLLNVVLSIVLARIVSRIVLPCCGILAKWILIGRHKEGSYPMWGAYHTRWWLAQKAVSVFGKGVFGWSEVSNIWYYRLLGAKIGSGVTLKGAQLGEWDLLEIGDNVVSVFIGAISISSIYLYWDWEYYTSDVANI